MSTNSNDSKLLHQDILTVELRLSAVERDLLYTVLTLDPFSPDSINGETLKWKLANAIKDAREAQAGPASNSTVETIKDTTKRVIDAAFPCTREPRLFPWYKETT